jgi:hypothetical protein
MRTWRESVWQSTGVYISSILVIFFSDFNLQTKKSNKINIFCLTLRALHGVQKKSETNFIIRIQKLEAFLLS